TFPCLDERVLDQVVSLDGGATNRPPEGAQIGNKRGQLDLQGPRAACCRSLLFVFVSGWASDLASTSSSFANLRRSCSARTRRSSSRDWCPIRPRASEGSPASGVVSSAGVKVKILASCRISLSLCFRSSAIHSPHAPLRLRGRSGSSAWPRAC